MPQPRNRLITPDGVVGFIGPASSLQARAAALGFRITDIAVELVCLPPEAVIAVSVSNGVMTLSVAAD